MLYVCILSYFFIELNINIVKVIIKTIKIMVKIYLRFREYGKRGDKVCII